MDLEDKNQTKVTQIAGVQFSGFMDDDVKNYSSFEQFKTEYKEIVNNHFRRGK